VEVVSEIISPSFTEATAAKLGVSPRTVQQEVQIAERIAEDVMVAISSAAHFWQKLNPSVSLASSVSHALCLPSPVAAEQLM